MQTITRGDSGKARSGNFGLHLYRVLACGHQTEKVQERYPDVKEQFGIHAYNDLMAFVTDSQQNPTDKPTKIVQKQLNDWTTTYGFQRGTNGVIQTPSIGFTISSTCALL
jgi:hypothetical protein